MLTDSGREWDIQQLLDLTGWNDQVHVAGSGKSLSESGLVTVTENHVKLISLDSEGKKALESGLLEEDLELVSRLRYRRKDYAESLQVWLR